MRAPHARSKVRLFGSIDFNQSQISSVAAAGWQPGATAKCFKTFTSTALTLVFLQVSKTVNDAACCKYNSMIILIYRYRETASMIVKTTMLRRRRRRADHDADADADD